MKVLIIEDEATQAMAMATVLRRRGFVVFTALSLAETCDLLEAIDDVDAAICDYHVPDIRGTELAQLFTTLNVPHLYYTCDPDAPVDVKKVLKPNFHEVIDWLNDMAIARGSK